MNLKSVVLLACVVSASLFGAIQSLTVPFQSTPSRAAIELKNDGFVDSGAPVYLQQGFITGEMAGVWLKVPTTVTAFKVDYFRVLVSGARRSTPATRLQAFFSMGISTGGTYSPAIPRGIENAVNVTPGHYWNDIPAQDANNHKLPCAYPGDLIGGALEFTHDGLPSVGRDNDGMSNPLANTLFAIPGGWTYSAELGLEGDWILRIIGHEVPVAECQ